MTHTVVHGRLIADERHQRGLAPAGSSTSGIRIYSGWSQTRNTPAHDHQRSAPSDATVEGPFLSHQGHHSMDTRPGGEIRARSCQRWQLAPGIHIPQIKHVTGVVFFAFSTDFMSTYRSIDSVSARRLSTEYFACLAPYQIPIESSALRNNRIHQ